MGRIDCGGGDDGEPVRSPLGQYRYTGQGQKMAWEHADFGRPRHAPFGAFGAASIRTVPRRGYLVMRAARTKYYPGLAVGPCLVTLLAGLVIALPMLAAPAVHAAAVNPAETFVQENLDRAFAILNNTALSDEQRNAAARHRPRRIERPRYGSGNSSRRSPGRSSSSASTFQRPMAGRANDRARSLEKSAMNNRDSKRHFNAQQRRRTPEGGAPRRPCNRRKSISSLA